MNIFIARYVLPSGCVIQIEYGWRCIKTRSMELIAVSTGEFCKLFKVTSFHCFLHLLDPLRYHLLFTPMPKVVAPLASVAKIELTMVPNTAIDLHCIASFSPSAAIYFHSIASFPLLVTVDCYLSWCIDNLLFNVNRNLCPWNRWSRWGLPVPGSGEEDWFEHFLAYLPYCWFPSVVNSPASSTLFFCCWHKSPED